MPRLIALLAVLAGCGRIGFDPIADLLDGFAFRQRIDIRSSQLTTPLTSFPLFVRVGSADPAMAPTPQDLRFTAPDGETLIPFEIESPEHGATLLDAWVLVPELRGPTTDEVIWAYFGNPDATGAAAPHEVWTDPFLGVWHFGDGLDSTANNLSGTFTGTAIVDGVASLGRDLSGSGYFEVASTPATAAIANGGAATWSAWVRLASLPNPGTLGSLVSRATDATVQNDFWMGASFTGSIEGENTVDPGQQKIPLAGGTLQAGAWTQIALVRAGSESRLIVNGAQVDSSVVTGTVHPSANPLLFGADCNTCGGTPNADFVDGVIDEARIQNVARPAAWLLAEYLNLTGGLVQVGAVERR